MLLDNFRRRRRMRASKTTEMTSSATWTMMTATRTHAALNESALSGALFPVDEADSDRDRKRSEIVGMRRDQNCTLSVRRWRLAVDELVSMRRKSAVEVVKRFHVGSVTSLGGGSDEREPGFPDGFLLNAVFISLRL
jgi:hypothetical protein